MIRVEYSLGERGIERDKIKGKREEEEEEENSNVCRREGRIL